MEAAAHDPGAGFCRFDSRSHHGDDVIPIAGGAEIEAYLRFADAHEVAVAFDETGDGKLTVEIDDLRLSTLERWTFGLRADGDDATVADGECMNFRMGGIERDDLPLIRMRSAGGEAEKEILRRMSTERQFLSMEKLSYQARAVLGVLLVAGARWFGRKRLIRKKRTGKMFAPRRRACRLGLRK